MKKTTLALSALALSMGLALSPLSAVLLFIISKITF